MNDIESQVRATLAEHAGRAPRPNEVAARILAEVATSGTVLRRRRRWNTWGLPLLAAGAVAAMTATIVGVSAVRHTAAPRPPAATHVVPSSPSPSVHHQPAPPARSTPPSPHATASATKPASGPAVTGFQALDATFVSADRGWALGSARCVQGAGRCTALFRTTDGKIWASMPGSAFNVPGVNACSAPCVDHIRFATRDVGYAYSSDTLFMTRDGGLHWTQQPGRGAEALESLGGNVIRLVSDGSGCPGPCNVRAETAAIGSSNWVTVRLQPAELSPIGVQLSRNGSDAYVLATRNAAGGGPATSTLYVSRDDGTSWQVRSEPCPQARNAANRFSSEVDSTALAAAHDGAVSVLCAPRGAGSPMFVAVSHDHGATFSTRGGVLPAVNLLAGGPGTVLVAAYAGAYRSTDGGAHWSPIPELSGRLTFVGFESDAVARAVTDAGRMIWTTTDGGRTWSSFEFP